MDIGFGESTSEPPQNSSYSSSSSSDAGSFECNICFELAQDPIVTLCGHLYCWPCLYKWLNIHSHSQECPVCKALVQEEKLVPLYGRGKTPTDPRSKSVLGVVVGVDIPNRPSGQRPATAPHPDPHYFPQQQAFGFMGGSAPMAATRIGNFTLSTTLGAFIPSLFNIHFNGFPHSTMYGAAATGFSYGYPHSFHGGYAPYIPQPARRDRDRRGDSNLKLLLIAIGLLVIFSLIIW